jgi:hypothetical protein
MLNGSVPKRLYLLSPANVNGKRAQMVKRAEATFDLALRLRAQGAPLGEVFSFMSGLYFRGKLTYANAFGSSPPGLEHAFVITSSLGLVSPRKIITLQDLDALAATPISSADPTYLTRLKQDAHQLAKSAGPECSIVLLGSVATTKYLEPLAEVFGERLFFPEEFVGRGDLSRGGLLLRAAASGIPLRYVPLGSATRHGPRPKRLSQKGKASRIAASK